MNSYLTIGEVVQKLKREFKDLSVSKLRYLEDEGLVDPQRTESGYRQFSPVDIERITLVLKLQADLFLPLAVIKQKLQLFDQGIEVPEINRVLGTEPELAPEPLHAEEPLKLSEAARAAQVPESFIIELKKYGIIDNTMIATGSAIDSGDLECIRAAWGLRSLGVEPRHLRMYATFADKEALIFEQFLRPTYRHKTFESI